MSIIWMTSYSWHLIKWICDQQVEVFLEICAKIKFPVALEKTCWATNLITFLGVLLDKVNQIVAIPENKIDKALTQIQSVLSCRKHKVMVLEIQKLCGILNFLCQAIVLGRPFLMQLYASLKGMEAGLKPFHHVKLAEDVILDLQVWAIFLQSQSAYSRPFLDFSSYVSAIELDWYTDAAKAKDKGYGGHHNQAWFHGVWDDIFLLNKDPSIEFLELYAVAVSALLWTRKHKNS